MNRKFMIFLLGAAAGAGVTFLALQAKYERLFEEEVERIEADMRAESREKRVKPVAHAEDLTFHDYSGDKVKKMIKRYDTNGNFHLEEVLENQHPMDDDEEMLAYIISEEDFAETNQDYDKVTIYYYAEDQVLCDEDETSIFEDVPSIVGYNALDSFGMASGDENIVYVRNDRLKIDYEVIRWDRSYSEEVLGEHPKDGEVDES